MKFPSILFALFHFLTIKVSIGIVLNEHFQIAIVVGFMCLCMSINSQQIH